MEEVVPILDIQGLRGRIVIFKISGGDGVAIQGLIPKETVEDLILRGPDGASRGATCRFIFMEFDVGR